MRTSSPPGLRPKLRRNVADAVVDHVNPARLGHALFQSEAPLRLADADDGGGPAGSDPLGKLEDGARRRRNAVADGPAVRRIDGRDSEFRGDGPADPSRLRRVQAEQVRRKLAHLGLQFAQRQEVADRMNRTPQRIERTEGHAGCLKLFGHGARAAGEHYGLVPALEHRARHVAHVYARAADGIGPGDDVGDPHRPAFRETMTRKASFRNTALATAGTPGISRTRASGASRALSLSR